MKRAVGLLAASAVAAPMGATAQGGLLSGLTSYLQGGQQAGGQQAGGQQQMQVNADGSMQQGQVDPAAQAAQQQNLNQQMQQEAHQKLGINQQQQQGGQQQQGQDPYAQYMQPLDAVDLTCLQKGGDEATQSWYEIQQKMAYMLPPDAAFRPVAGEVFEQGLNAIMMDLQKAETSDGMHKDANGNFLINPANGQKMKNPDFECGVGKLMIQMMALLQKDVDGTEIEKEFDHHEQLTSPIMTMLLDVPYTSMHTVQFPHKVNVTDAQTGQPREQDMMLPQQLWPYFALLAQMSLRRTGALFEAQLNQAKGMDPQFQQLPQEKKDALDNDVRAMVEARYNAAEVDGIVHEQLIQVSNALHDSVGRGDFAGIREVTKIFLDAGTEAAEMSPLAFLCCLFGQAATAPSQEEAVQLLIVAQETMRKIVQTPQHVSKMLMTSRWPIFHLAYLATVRVNTAP